MALSIEEIARLRAAIEEQGPVRAHHAKKWTSGLAHIAESIAAKGDPDGAYISLFWLRLQQILAELLPYCEESKAVHERFGLDDRAKLFAAVVERCLALKATFNEDELMWLQYRRDTEGHIWQESYEIGVRGLANGAKIKESRNYEVIGKTVNVEDAMLRMRALLRKYGDSINAAEDNIAIDFAKRSAVAIRAVAEALRPFDKLALNLDGKI
jgi:hypothetical protein